MGCPLSLSTRWPKKNKIAARFYVMRLRRNGLGGSLLDEILWIRGLISRANVQFAKLKWIYTLNLEP
jgi:hypothetical protein